MRDGNLITFSSERPDGWAAATSICMIERPASIYPCRDLTRASHEYSPSLSPDGRYLVFVSDRVEGVGERDIYLYDRQTQKLLPTPGLNSKTEDYDPCVMRLKAAE